MIIFLYGEDTYRMKEKVKEIIEHYKKIHKTGLNLKYFNNFTDFKDSLKQTSMFKEKKLIIINNIFLNPEFKEKFLENKGDFLKTDDIILLCQEDNISKNDSLFKFLKKNAKCQEFELLSNYKLKNWIKKEFEKYNGKISSQGLEKLIEYVSNDLWRMSNEIKKLASFSKVVEEKDIELLIRSRIETDIFKTIDAIAEKNKKQALKLLHKHLEKGDSPLYLLSMINYQFRNLLVIKSRCSSINEVRINSLSKELKIHPFVVRKSLWQIKRFTFEELKKIYQKIFEVDLNIKTGRIEPEIGLDLLITEI